MPAGSIPAAIHSDAEIEEWVAVEVIAHREVWAAVDTEDWALAVMVLDDGWIDQLYVDPAWTGMGLGSRLVELAKSRSPEGLQLWTFASKHRRAAVLPAPRVRGRRSDRRIG